MKSSVQMKSKSEKKGENNGGTRRSSRVSIVSRSKSRVSSVSMYNAGQGLSWRSDGKGSFKMPKYQNSYHLEPYLPFSNRVSDRLLVQALAPRLEGLRYEATACLELCREAARDIRDKLYKTDYDRVKYAVTVSIVENSGQSLAMANGRSWDSERDTYSLFVYEGPHLLVVGMIVAMYYE